jgi:D123
MDHISDDVVDDGDNVLSSSPEPATVTILPTLNDVLACQFSRWYPIFSNLSNKYRKRTNVTIKSCIIKPLPSEFLQYLLSDTSKDDQRFILPHNSRTSSALLEANNRRDDTDAWSSSSDDSEHDNNTDETIIHNETTNQLNPPKYSFPELNEQIHNAIQSFSNQVCIPKLNWSSPKDAIWINGNQNTMECRTAGDVYLLLKASDFISYDLVYARTDIVLVENDVTDSHNPHTTTTTNGDDDDDDDNNKMQKKNIDQNNFSFELVLRKFCNLYPSQEFRCFISYNTVLGISQRHQQYHFPFLPQHQDEYLELICDFYNLVIRPNVHQMSYHLQQYVVDLYIDQQQRIWIIDFNVWGTRTDALLFHWSELITLANQAELKQQQRQNIDDAKDGADRESGHSNIDLRIVESSLSNDANGDGHHHHHHQQPPPIYPNPLSNYKAPMDALFLRNHGDVVTTATTTFQDFMKLCVRPSTIKNSRNTDDASSSSSSDAEE